MKVLYLANGLPHYFNLVLSKLASTPDLDLLVVTPKGQGKYIGEGVFQSRAGVDFRIVELREYSIGRVFVAFAGLPGLLLTERPDVVVLQDHLLIGFFLHPGLVIARKIVGARLILKSIPFLLLDYSAAVRRLSERKCAESHLAKALELMGVRRLLRQIFLELRRFCFRMVDAHVNYVDAAREIYGSYGVPLERIFVTRNSPDTDAMAKTEAVLRATDNPPEHQPYTILHVGRLVPQKRLDLLLDAFSFVLARIPQAELVVVGDGPELKAYALRAENLNISRAVRFVGPVYEPTELGRHFLSASVFVLPGLGGLSINEAMFYGLAIACAAGDGTERYLVREGYNGTFFRQGDSSSLAVAILRLLADQNELARMGSRSREIIDREVNIGTVVDSYLKAFRYVCQ
jgi:glycosyltransferase involved in cell wall biosynthesis